MVVWCMQGAGQVLRVTSSCVETLDVHSRDVVHSYPFSDVVEYHAMTLLADRYRLHVCQLGSARNLEQIITYFILFLL